MPFGTLSLVVFSLISAWLNDEDRSGFDSLRGTARDVCAEGTAAHVYDGAGLVFADVQIMALWRSGAQALRRPGPQALRGTVA